MLLAFNTIITEKYKGQFDNLTLPKITKSFPYEVIHLNDPILETFSADETIFSKYTHLLVSGSSLSASQGSVYDKIIIKIIQYFLKNNRSILGICYGHQMIARAILGDSACRKTKIPEFGWKKMEIKENPLFNGISNPIFLESHYDEVCNLTDDFTIIASNNDCEVQAMQYKNLPIWGTQFHPEMGYNEGSQMAKDHIVNYPKDKQYYTNDLTDETVINQNFIIFDNFLGVR
jgi:GMP synthase-like glutamine amidotransferase